MPGLAAGVPDVGLTSDTLLSLVAAGQRQAPGFAASLAAVAGHLSGYASFPVGHGTTALLAGPLAKTLVLAQVSGADPTSFGGVNLPATVRSLLTTSGPDAGRFSDRETGSDTSNGFSQGFAILGLLRDPGDVPSAAVSFLLAQQCPSGAFRLFYDVPGGCRSNSQADPDATSVAIQTLTALSRTDPAPALSTARSSAASWLAAQQQADGGLGGAGPTAGENANSTALAAIAFRETGLTTAAEAAQRYVAGLQLTGGADAGAIAYDPAALASVGRTGPIPRTDQDQWRRSTSQAILAFGLPGYDDLPTVSGAPLPPGTPTPAPPTPGTPTPAPPSSAPPTSVPAAPSAALQAPGAPAPVTSTPDAATDPAGQFDPAGTDFAPDDGSANDAADQPIDGADMPQPDDSPASSPSPVNSAQPTPAPAQTNVPLTHTTPQAAVTPKSADGGVPSWIWIVVAAVAGIGGGTVVLRLQAKRAKS